MARAQSLAALTAVMVATGCTVDVGRSTQPIINGEVDTTHQGVVALVGTDSACTGTIVGVDGEMAYVLTAAHCFALGPLDDVRVGNDHKVPDQILTIVDHQIHPSYDPQASKYDFAMVRASGADAATPVIEVLTPAEDAMAAGAALLHVGYGLTSWPAGKTTQRHAATGTISTVYPAEFDYLQPTSGPCSGDSGGPNLVFLGLQERVAGVVSYGDQECSQFGVSGRVSAVYDLFVAPFMSLETTAAGTGVAASSGAGSSGAGDSGWVAGDGQPKVYRGEAAGCSAAARNGHATRRGAPWVSMLLVVLLSAIASRSRARK